MGKRRVKNGEKGKGLRVGKGEELRVAKSM
jgi:hypothetical protein